MSWAAEIFAELLRDEAVSPSDEEEWFECGEWPAAECLQYDEDPKTPQQTTTRLFEDTPSKRRADGTENKPQMTKFDLGAPAIRVEQQRWSEGLWECTKGTGETVFAFDRCFLCGSEGCGCGRQAKKKKQRRQRYGKAPQATEVGLREQWTVAAKGIKVAMQMEGSWRRVSEFCVSAQVGRVQARICRFVTKAAVLRQLMRVFSRERVMRQRDKATQVEISQTAVGIQTRSAKANLRCKAVQCEAETTAAVTQTEGSECEQKRVVTAAVQTKRPKTKTQD